MSDHSLFLLRALSDRDVQKRLVRELQQQLAELRSQPRLQPVTPEAMAKLEGRDNATIVTCDHDAAWVYRWSRKTRWTANRRPATRPTWGWFIDLSTIPEVQQ